MSAPTVVGQTFKSFLPKQWPAMSKHVRKMHEHTRTRGFTEEEIRWFKAKNRWVKGEVVERAERSTS